MSMGKSSLITKLVILAVMIFAVVTLVSLRPQIREEEHLREQNAEAVAELEQENLELQEDIDALGSDASTREIARERLNMVADGEVIYVDTCK